MKDRMNIQGVIQSKMRESESDMKNSVHVGGTDEAKSPYTFPLDPERKKRIAEAFQRRVDIQTSHEESDDSPIRRSGW